MKDCSGITFVCTGDDAFTLKSAATEAGSPSTLATITDYYTCTSTAGAAAWVSATQSAADSVTIASGAVAFYVDAGDLPSAAEYVSVTQGSGGLVTAVLHDLESQRTPPNLRNVSGSSS